MIAGEFRSRQLSAPRGDATRPTSDRLRETLFNVLGPQVREARFLDLYAGSGAVGIEALSRGGAVCWFVERAPAALLALRANLQQLGLGGRSRVEARSALAALQRLAEARESMDFVFLDPPYEAAGEYTEVLNLLGREGERLLRPGAVVVAEHAKRHPLPERFGQLRRWRLLQQSDAALSFYGLDSSREGGLEGGPAKTTDEAAEERTPDAGVPE